MTCTSTTGLVELALDDVAAGVRFFREILALPVRRDDFLHTEVRLTPGLSLRLVPAPGGAPAAPRPATGPVLELRVPDVGPAVAELRRRGATVLIEPVITEWGTESAFIAGPGDLVIEICCPLPRG